MKRAAGVVLWLGLPAVALAQKPTQDVLRDEEKGFELIRPKDKDNSWKVGKEGAHLYKDTDGVIAHRADNISIEFVCVVKNDNEKFPDLKDFPDRFKEEFKESGATVTTSVDATRNKFQCRGAGYKAIYVTVELKEKDTTKLKFAQWIFTDNRNRLFRISIVGPDDMRKKYERETAMALANMAIFNPKKKRP